MNPTANLDRVLKLTAMLVIALMFALVGVLGLIYAGPVGWLALAGFAFCQLPLRRDA